MRTQSSILASLGQHVRLAALTLAGLAAALMLPGAVAQNAAPPERLTYQGFLVDGNGVPLGNTAPKNYDIELRIWNHESQSATGPNGNLLWGEQQTVTVDRGHFSVLLHEGAPLDGVPRPDLSTLFRGPTASDRWVSITVKGIGSGGANVNILPRLRLLSSPYAFLAQQANKLVQNNGTDLISANGNAVTVDGPLTAASFAGSGAGLTGLNAGNLTTGTLSLDRLHPNVARRDAENTFAGNQTTSGHLRVGLLENSAITSAGYGRAVIFSGGPRLSATWNNDNSDPLWIARYNAAANATQLRISIGDDLGGGDDRLVIGTTTGSADFTQGGTWTPLFSVDNRGILELRPDVVKEASAGKIGYEAFTAGALDIVGAGTAANTRKVKIWSEGRMEINGGVNVNGGIFARGGYPGANGVNNSGYAFTGNGGDNDSGMFSDTDGHVRFTSNSQLMMSVYPSGVYVHGGLFAGSMPFGDYRNVQWNDSTGRIGYDNSSRRFKENIQTLEDDFEKLLQMEPKTYTRPGQPDRWEIGYIAEEFHDAGLVRLVEYDKEGQPDGINYEKITLYLTELARRQAAEIAALKEKTAAQEARLAAQERALETLQGRMVAMERLVQEAVAGLKASEPSPSAVVASLEPNGAR